MSCARILQTAGLFLWPAFVTGPARTSVNPNAIVHRCDAQYRECAYHRHANANDQQRFGAYRKEPVLHEDGRPTV